MLGLETQTVLHIFLEPYEAEVEQLAHLIILAHPGDQLAKEVTLAV